jgi:hypothetical protein
MASAYSINLPVYNAEQFKRSVSLEDGPKLYLTFGKPVPWANDAAPAQANSSVTSFNEIWKNMVGAKLITGFDISHAIVRNDWQANTEYAAYDHCTCSLDLVNSNSAFYVVTKEWNVYKCISNNSGALSTVQPTNISTTNLSKEIDGYVWKYMYTISPSERLKFTTDRYIPVKIISTDDNSLQWQVQENATPGSIDEIFIINGGDNYTDANNITISITGDGIGANAIAQVNTMSNTISSITMVERGVGYTFANVRVISAAGANAEFKAIISPVGGHGSDPLRELGGSYLILNPRLNGDEDGILDIDNEYRQISIIKDPLLYNGLEVASNTVVNQLMILSLNGVSNEYVEDELVYQGPSPELASFFGTVVSWDSANSIIKLSNVVGNPITDLLIGQNSAASRFVDSVTNPTLKPYSGKLLYIDNIGTVQRNQNQVEDFKIILKF